MRLDAGADPTERARAARALDADLVVPLVAGWRAYRLPAPVSAAEAARELATAGAEGRVQLDAPLQAAGDDPLLAAGQQWGLENTTWPAGTPGADIDARAGWRGLNRREEVVVAVIDTGVEIDHPDLRDRLWRNPEEVDNGRDDDGDGRIDDLVGWDFANDDATVFDAADDESHGTHVAGTIGAARGNDVGVAGIADNARIMPLKFLGPGGGWTSDAIRAISYAVEHDARVINASWGGSAYSAALCDALGAAADAGVLVAMAAGNDGEDRDAVPSWPANCAEPDAIVVAATTADDGLADFSATGPTQVDVGAPGETVLSTVPGGYGYMSGTSMAAPHVAGIAAALLGERPELTPAQVRQALIEGGDALPELAGATVSGRRASLTGALGITPSAPAPLPAPVSPAPPPSVAPAPSPAAAPAPTPAAAPADRLAPEPFALLAPAAGAATADRRPSFSWARARDAGAGVARYELRIGGLTVATAGAGATAARPSAALPDGRHAWSVWAVDAAGNGRPAAARTIVVDTVAPAAPRLLAPSTRRGLAAGRVDVRYAAAADRLSGTRLYRVELDGVVVATSPTPRPLRLRLRPGTHRLRISAVDAAGNAAASPVRRLRVAARS